MQDTRMYELANELLRRSKSKKLQWKQTVRDDAKYRLNFPDVTIEISRDAFNGNDWRYQLTLINETGVIVDTISWRPSDTATKDPGLQDVFELAEAYSRDGTIDRAIQYLKYA